MCWYHLHDAVPIRPIVDFPAAKLRNAAPRHLCYYWVPGTLPRLKKVDALLSQ